MKLHVLLQPLLELKSSGLNGRFWHNCWSSAQEWGLDRLRHFFVIAAFLGRLFGQPQSVPLQPEGETGVHWVILTAEHRSQRPRPLYEHCVSIKCSAATGVTDTGWVCSWGWQQWRPVEYKHRWEWEADHRRRGRGGGEEEKEASLSLDHMNVKINRSTCGAAVCTVYTGLHSQPLLECIDTLCISTL